MHLSNLKLWNFRKFGTGKEFKITDKPHLNLNFKKGLNVLIGENHSCKSAIIDAIKLVLKIHSYEWINIDKDDFCNDALEFRIELIFDNLSDEEAKNFTEWFGWKKVKKLKDNVEVEENEPYLKLNYHAERNNQRIFPTKIRSSVDEDGYPLNPEAKEYLKCTYLKPLRDAVNELGGVQRL